MAAETAVFGRMPLSSKSFLLVDPAVSQWMKLPRTGCDFYCLIGPTVCSLAYSSRPGGCGNIRHRSAWQHI